MRKIPTLGCVALLSALVGCINATTHPVGSGDPQLDESRLAEPPEDWVSAATFSFPDSSTRAWANYATRIQFNDGLRDRTVTAAELFNSTDNALRTPWFRLRPGKQYATSIRFTIEHRGGITSVAEYPITFQPDEFYRFQAGITNRAREREGGWPLPANLRGYPLNPAAGAEPGDSIWIFFTSRNRSCFWCPT